MSRTAKAVIILITPWVALFITMIAYIIVNFMATAEAIPFEFLIIIRWFLGLLGLISVIAVPVCGIIAVVLFATKNEENTLQDKK